MNTTENTESPMDDTEKLRRATLLLARSILALQDCMRTIRRDQIDAGRVGKRDASDFPERLNAAAHYVQNAADLLLPRDEPNHG